MRRQTTPKGPGLGVQVVLNLLAFCVVMTLVAMPAKVTPMGKQCPTAPIQSIATPKGTRAPKMGEKGFQQCQCAEKRAVKSQTELQGVVSCEAILPATQSAAWTPQTIVRETHFDPLQHLTAGYTKIESPPPQA